MKQKKYYVEITGDGNQRIIGNGFGKRKFAASRVFALQQSYEVNFPQLKFRVVKMARCE